MSLLIAMPGLPEMEADVPGMRAALPALPVLSALLVRARRLADAADWRAGILAALGASSDQARTAVAIAARAVRVLSAGAALCFAAPLHVVAGMSRVHLPPGGRLQLDAAEAARWVDAFNLEFGGPDLHLHAAPGGWLLAASCAAAARDPAPEVLVGQPLVRVAAGDAAERALRLLGAEAEMWLAAHPLNREREARRLPPINNLWFWGGGHALPLAQFERPARAVFVAGDPDAWLAGLAAHCSVPLRKATAWQSVTQAATNEALLVLMPPPDGVSAIHWQQLEANWFEPASRALREGSLDALRLQIGGSAWQLPDHSPLRWLRRRRPWYELAGA